MARVCACARVHALVLWVGVSGYRVGGFFHVAETAAVGMIYENS